MSWGGRQVGYPGPMLGTPYHVTYPMAWLPYPSPLWTNRYPWTDTPPPSKFIFNSFFAFTVTFEKCGLTIRAQANTNMKTTLAKAIQAFIQFHNRFYISVRTSHKNYRFQSVWKGPKLLIWLKDKPQEFPTHPTDPQPSTCLPLFLNAHPSQTRMRLTSIQLKALHGI